ncbi:helix-turn-helix domain-containing protein [Curtobacterium sp. 9128]|uniref:helix-turn-helix domain-containing protein n=1 Tax=Curtobacterium sp. 9128 TaxID=1793722 RepID=UPI001642DC31|nr:helix-turn-helix domain-containing protein [Curtobacterium sp. 9128]
MSSHRTVDRVVGILDVVARADRPPTLSEIARGIGAPTSSAHDLVAGLVEHGWLVPEGRRFRVGAAPLVLDLLAHGDGPGPDVDVDAIAEQFSLGVATAVRVGHHVVYTQRSRDLPMQFASIFDRHVLRDPLTTAAGRLLLAVAPHAARQAVLRAARAVDPDAVRDYERVVASIRRDRTAWSDGLSDPRVAAAAVQAAAGETGTAIVLFGDRAVDNERLRVAVQSLRDRG